MTELKPPHLSICKSIEVRPNTYPPTKHLFQHFAGIRNETCDVIGKHVTDCADAEAVSVGHLAGVDAAVWFFISTPLAVSSRERNRFRSDSVPACGPCPNPTSFP